MSDRGKLAPHVEEIRMRRNENHETYDSIARRFDSSIPAIRRVCIGETYREDTDHRDPVERQAERTSDRKPEYSTCNRCHGTWKWFSYPGGKPRPTYGVCAECAEKGHRLARAKRDGRALH